MGLEHLFNETNINNIHAPSMETQNHETAQQMMAALEKQTLQNELNTTEVQVIEGILIAQNARARIRTEDCRTLIHSWINVTCGGASFWMSFANERLSDLIVIFESIIWYKLSGVSGFVL